MHDAMPARVYLRSANKASMTAEATDAMHDAMPARVYLRSANRASMIAEATDSMHDAMPARVYLRSANKASMCALKASLSSVSRGRFLPEILLARVCLWSFLSSSGHTWITERPSWTATQNSLFRQAMPHHGGIL